MVVMALATLTHLRGPNKVRALSAAAAAAKTGCERGREPGAEPLRRIARETASAVRIALTRR